MDPSARFSAPANRACRPPPCRYIRLRRADARPLRRGRRAVLQPGLFERGHVLGAIQDAPVQLDEAGALAVAPPALQGAMREAPAPRQLLLAVVPDGLRRGVGSRICLCLS